MRLLIVLGTRPEMIKLAPVIHECGKHADIEAIVCSTGQHVSLLKGLASFFEISVDIDLGVMSPEQSLASLTARCLEGLDRVIEQHRLDYVVVQGDTATAAAGALAAFYRAVPVVHIEAGLHTNDIRSPFPEEMNRRLITMLADVYMAPTLGAVDNLLRTGVEKRRIFCTGNTSIDALRWAVSRQPALSCDTPLVLITAHRRENYGKSIDNLCGAVRELSEKCAADFVWPVHPNPQIAKPVHALLDGSTVQLSRPLQYAEFVNLLSRASLVITDSGGVQEEAVALGKPVLVTRTTTERVEGVRAGAAILVGTDRAKIVSHAEAILSAGCRVPNDACTVYGNGFAAVQIIDHLRQLQCVR